MSRIAAVMALVWASGCVPTGDPPAYEPVLEPDVGASADGDTPTPDAAVEADTGEPSEREACLDLDDDGFVAGDDCDLPGGDCAPEDPERNPGRAEACNLLDDDCDRITDEDDPGGGEECDTGRDGICSAGVTACSQGEPRCETLQRPRGETCNGADDDCDGVSDEENPGGGEACETGFDGLCARGTRQCVDGDLRCVPDIESAAETCDGRDEDCDGATDEENPGGGAACETGLDGVCNLGVQACAGGELGCVATNEPDAETCDGLDEDCDGVTDETWADELGAPCTVGVGACERESTVVCAEDAAGVTCDASAGNGAAELCNGADDDCDETLDEGYELGADCEVGLGACQRAGTTVCAEDEQGTDCDATPGEPVDELCNGLDDDCDGAVDEAYPMLGMDCVNDDGLCPSPGTLACAEDGEGVSCDAEPVLPGEELCDDLDNDCDGVADEDFPLKGEACEAGDGACRAEGVFACTGEGALGCDAVAGEPGAEQCNEIDDDCDGRIDNRAPCPGPPTGVVESLRIAQFGEAVCPDLDGDGRPDNGLGAVAGLFGRALEASVLDGSRTLLIRAPGLPGAATDIEFVEGRRVDGEPAADSRALDAEGRAFERIEGVAAGDDLSTPNPAERLRVLSPLFYSPAPGLRDAAFLDLADAKVAGEYALVDAGLVLDGVVLSGTLDRDAVLAAYVAAQDACDDEPGCAIFDDVDAETLAANLQADLDGGRVSACLVLSTVGAASPPLGGQPCGADSDCFEGLTCRPVPVVEQANRGAALANRCGVPGGAGQTGEGCASDLDCANAFCVAATADGGRCSTLCDDDAECPVGFACRGVARDVDGALNLGGASARACVPVSGSGADCAEGCPNDEVCGVWLDGAGVAGGQVEPLALCQTPDPGADLGDGCDDAFDCVHGNGCVDDFADALRCAAPCDGAGQCDGGSVCVDREVAPGLVYGFCLPVPPELGSARPCGGDADCPGGETCNAEHLEAADAVERWCVRGEGFFAVGQPCEAAADCASGRCAEGFCGGLCAEDADCGPRLSCAEDARTDAEGRALGGECGPVDARCVRDIDCDDDPDCAGGRCVCDQRRCRLGCRFPGACPGDLYCEPGNVCAPFCRDDDDEPDDSLAEATLLDLGRANPVVSVRRQLCGTSSVDWFRFNTGGRAYTVEVEPLNADEDVRFEAALFDAFGAPLADAVDDDGVLVGGEDRGEDGLRALRVRAAGVDGSADYQLTMRLEPIDCPDPAEEPRDQSWEWTELNAAVGAEVAERVEAWICPGDTDWYGVWLDNGDRLVVDLEVAGNDGRDPENQAIELALIGPDHPELASSVVVETIEADANGGRFEFQPPALSCPGDGLNCSADDGRATQVVCFDESDCRGAPWFLRVRGAGGRDLSAYALEVEVERAEVDACTPDLYETDENFVVLDRLRAALEPGLIVPIANTFTLAPDTDVVIEGRRICGRPVGPGEDQNTIVEWENIRVIAAAGDTIEARLEQHVQPAQSLTMVLFELDGQANLVERADPDQPVVDLSFDIPRTGTYTVSLLRFADDGFPANYENVVPYTLTLRHVTQPVAADPGCEAPRRLQLVNNRGIAQSTLVGKTDDHRPLACVGGGGGDEVYVVRLPAGRGALQATAIATADDALDPAIALRTDCDAAGSEVACNEDDPTADDPFRRARVRAPFDGGRDVFIHVDSYAPGREGAYRLELAWFPE